MKLAIGCDHAAVDFKNKIIAYLTDLGYTCEDFGTYTDESCDYPVYADKVCNAVTGSGFDKGILICGTGIGMSIAANKHKGIRCVACSEPLSAKLSRMHNDTNVLALGARVIGIETGKDIVSAWLSAEFEGGRHMNRISMFE